MPFPVQSSLHAVRAHNSPYTQRYFSMKFAEVGCHKHYTSEVVHHAYDHVLFAMMVKGNKTIDIAGGSTTGGNTIEFCEGNSLFSYAPIRATSHSDDIKTSDSQHETFSPSVCITLEIDREKIHEIMYRVVEQNELQATLHSLVPMAGTTVGLANGLGTFTIASGGVSSSINETIKSIFHISSDGITFKDRLVELKLEELILYTLQSDLRTALMGNLQKYSSSVSLAYVIDYIHTNLHSHLSVETLAEKANVSVASFYRHFKSAFGVTPNDYISHKRMESAKFMLENSALSIADISDKLGYSSQQHFAKLFRSVWGVCPSSIRPKNKGGQ